MHYNFYLLFILIIIISCTREHPRYSREQIKQFTLACMSDRIDKDNGFKDEEQSPLLKDDLPTFKGLHYFDYDPDFRFEGPLTFYEQPDTVIILGSKGDQRPALKVGYFEFSHQEKNYHLQIFKMVNTKPEYANYLFLGFTDLTSGEESYGGGRYIDLELKNTNQYVIDFNYAYNPYCAYNPKYSCAIPDKENFLPIAVKAGEKKWHE